MQIRDLIDVLEQYEHDSQHQDETEVTITLHCLEHNGSGFYIEKRIYDVEISYGSSIDAVEIAAVLFDKDLDELQKMRNTLVQNNLLEND